MTSKYGGLLKRLIIMTTFNPVFILRTQHVVNCPRLVRYNFLCGFMPLVDMLCPLPLEVPLYDNSTMILKATDFEHTDAFV